MVNTADDQVVGQNTIRPVMNGCALEENWVGGQGGKVMHRIAWTPSESGEVRQIWEFSRDGGEAWTTAFDGTYRPKS